MRKNIHFHIIFLILFIIIIVSVFLRQPKEQVEIDETDDIEESKGSGFLDVQTFPGNAGIFLDDVYKGNSPDTLYNIPAGTRKVVIKKEGYEDFASDVDIAAGRKTYLEVNLDPIRIVEEKEDIAKVIEEEVLEDEFIQAEEDNKEILAKTGETISLGSKFLLYYDFSEGKFADTRNFNEDIFSKRYENHLVFTRFDPVNIKAVDKNINDIEEEDCIGISGQFEFLYSGQSLCIITKENEIAAIGGNWDTTENAELIWKLFN